MAVAHATSPFITIYERSGTTFVKVPNPASLPTGNARGAAFSPDGSMLAVAHGTTPFLTVYEISGTTFTKIPDPTDLPGPSGPTNNAVSWSADGLQLAVGGPSPSNFLTIYSLSGTTLTKIAGVPQPPDSVIGLSYSPDGVHLALAHATSPFITIYERSGTTYTSLSAPATLPDGTAFTVSFRPDGEFMAVGSVVAPYLHVYQRSGSTYTSIDIENNVASASYAQWKRDGTLLTTPSAITGAIKTFTVTGSTATGADFEGNLDVTARSAAWSPITAQSGNLLAVGHPVTPFISIYSVSGSSGIAPVSPVGIIMDSAKEGFGLTDDVANWVFGILTVSLVAFAFFKVSGASAVATSIGGLLGVGLGVAFGFLPVWFLLLIIFTIVAVAGKNLFGGNAAGEM